MHIAVRHHIFPIEFSALYSNGATDTFDSFNSSACSHFGTEEVYRFFAIHKCCPPQPIALNTSLAICCWLFTCTTTQSTNDKAFST